MREKSERRYQVVELLTQAAVEEALFFLSLSLILSAIIPDGIHIKRAIRLIGTHDGLIEYSARRLYRQLGVEMEDAFISMSYIVYYTSVDPQHRSISIQLSVLLGLDVRPRRPILCGRFPTN